MRNQREQIVKHKILTLPNNSLNPQDSLTTLSSSLSVNSYNSRHSLTTLFDFFSKFAQSSKFADKNALK